MAKASEQNPFEYQEPLLFGGRGVLLERSRQTQQALQLLRRGGFLTVTAPPRSGVTTFLYGLKKSLPRSVYIDLANLAFVDDPPREAGRVLAREARAIANPNAISADPVSVTDVLSVIAREDSSKGADPLTVIADGFDAWSDEFARKLVLAFRAAYTESRTLGSSGQGGAFSIITGSSVDLRDLTASGRTSPLNIAQNIFLPDFEDMDVESLLRCGLEAIGNDDDIEVQQWVRNTMEWTYGHPALTQMFGHMAYSLRLAGVLNKDAWAKVVASAREEARELLSSTLGMLSERSDLRRTASEIYSGAVVPCDRIHRPIRELVHLGLIRADASGVARPRNQLYEQVLSAALNLSSPHPSVRLWNSTTGNVVMRPDGRPQVAGTQPDSGNVGVSVHASTEAPMPKDEAARRDLPVLSGGKDSANNDDLSALAPDDEARKAPMVKPGTVIGGCRIERRIGRGGMAEVYLAKHLGLDTDVAIKVLRQSPDADRRIAQRFLREARAAAQLSHENIVQIRNVGRDGEYQYIEMEYISGGNLAELLKVAPFRDIRFALRLLAGAAAGVEAAHKKGIIHRDIKPDNLMLARDGKVKVVDFGLAALGTLGGGTSSRLTQEGYILGTPHYMAPEQWEGKDVNERSDIYSLGVTFYHLLAGKLPFDGRTAIELISNFAATTPPLLVRYNPDVPVPLAHAIAKMIEKSQADRYPSIHEMTTDPNGLGSRLLKEL